MLGARPVMRAGSLLSLAVFLLGPVRSLPAAGAAQPSAVPANALASASATPLAAEGTLAELIGVTAVPGPVAYAALDRSPRRAEAMSGITDIRAAVAAVPLLQVGAHLRSSNPADGSVPAAPALALPGAQFEVETPTPGLARSTASLGIAALGVRASLTGSSRADGRAKAPVVQARSELWALDIGAALHIGALQSVVELAAAPRGPPVVTYSLTLADVRLGSRQVIGPGIGAVVVHGEKVPVWSLPEQFRLQVQGVKVALGELEASLRVLEPRVDLVGDGQVVVSAPAVDVAVLAGRGLPASLGLRLVATSVSVYAEPGDRAEAQPPANGTRRPVPGARQTSPPPPPSGRERGATGAPPEPTGALAPPSPGHPSQAAFPRPRSRATRRTAHPVLGARRAGSTVLLVVMGAAALNACLLGARAAILLVNARRGGD